MQAQQQRVRHLLRRFGLGASPKEVRELETLDLHEAVERLIEYDQASDPYPVSPWEFTCNPRDEKLNFNGRLMADWWALTMCVTARPLQERLALFWHDHFAVADDKVQDGRKMVQYVQILRDNATGNFGEMLTQVSKCPAMVVFLDARENVRGRPNENFAREVMELFTLGVDNGYTEQDVLEAAKAFTGWNLRDTLNYRDRANNPIESQVRAKVAADEDLFQFVFIPNRHEPGPKTVLGQTGEFDGDAVLKLLLDRPETAETVCIKLWEWLAYPKPEKEIVEKLAATFVKSGFEIKPVLREIASHAAFWSPKAVRTKVKSPVDFTVSVMRQFGVTGIVEQRGAGALEPFTPLHQDVRNFARAVNLQMRRQGLELLYPPSVEGWHWNEEWITTESMLYRIDMAKQVFSNRRMVAPLLEWATPEIAAEPGMNADPQVVDRLLTFLDLEVGNDQRFLLMRQARDLDLNNALLRGERFAVNSLWPFLKSVFAMPQAHMC